MKPVFTELNDGILITFEKNIALSDETYKSLCEKWNSVNEDGEVEDMLAEAAKTASPKGYIKALRIYEIGEDYVVLSGVRFESTLLPKHFKPILESGSKNVYAFNSTCGRELHDWASAKDDILLKGVAEDICLAYLGIAGKEVRDYAEREIYKGHYFSSVNPGSLPSWPITGQIPLFKTLGVGTEKTGVTLTDSQLMIPYKSTSGIFFEAEHNFESCMFCDKLDCPNRRAEYVGM